MKFVVIEGLDGSGKSTQIKMLQAYLTAHNIDFEYLHFPRTDAPFYGELVARFLRGELGANDAVNPYLVALIYAGDRKDAVSLMQQWFSSGKLVLVDRYVFSNIAYQCAKVSDASEKEKLKNWILDFEYGYNVLPKPMVNIFFDVPFAFTKNSLTAGRTGGDRDYLRGATDIHEADLSFQQRVRDMYVSLAQTEPSLKVINCNDANGMMAPDKIFTQLVQVLTDNNVI